MRWTFFYTTILIIILITACDIYQDNDKQNFEYDLQGTWRSTGTYFYSGELIIEHSNITINNYNTFWAENNLFRNFTPGVSLKGYSVKGEAITNTSRKGEIYIYDRGSLQDGISYLYWENYNSENKKQKFLTFNFGDYNETLKLIDEDE